MFSNIFTIEEAKLLYDKLAHLLHPDQGGDEEMMILLQQAYEERLEFLENSNELYVDCSISNDRKIIEKGDKRLHIISKLKKYSNMNPYFKTEYLDSVAEYLNNNGFITIKQYKALKNAYLIFKVEQAIKEK